MNVHNGRVKLTVEDDGKGLPVELPRRGMGLHIMEYRTKMIGGTLEVQRLPEGGTLVSCGFDNLPLSEQDTQSEE